MHARLVLRFVVTGLALVGVVTLGSVLLLRGPHDEEPPTSKRVAPAVVSGVEPERTVLEVVSATARSDAAVDESSTFSPSTSDHSETHGVQGTVLLVDEEGVEYSAESGTLRFDQLVGKDWRSTRAEVIGGRWRAELARSERTNIVEALFRGRRAFYADGPYELDLRSDEPLDLRLRWPSPIVLYARDAVTNTDLSQLEIVWKRDWSADDEDFHVFPRCAIRGGIITRSGSSPFRVPTDLFPGSWPEFGCLFIRAPGHAWTMVRFDCLYGGDLFAELPAAGHLDIELTGAKPDPSLWLSLDMPGVWHGFAKAIGSLTEMSIEDLPVGTCTITAQRGPYSAEFPLVLARADVEIVADARTRVRLELAPWPNVGNADLSGVVVIPSAWGGERPCIEAFLRGIPIVEGSHCRVVQVGPGTETEEADTYSWHLDDAQVGTYEVVCRDPPFSAIVELPEGGKSNVRIEVPSPADVRIDAVDAITGIEVAVHAMWTPLDSEGATPTWSAIGLMPTSSQTLRCEVGEVRLAVSAEESGYKNELITVTVHPGQNVVTLRMVKTADVLMTLMDGRRELLVVDCPFDVLDENGEHVPGLLWEEGGGGYAHVPDPGRYRVKLNEPMPGYMMPEEQVVELERGTLTKVVFQLVRKQ